MIPPCKPFRAVAVSATAPSHRPRGERWQRDQEEWLALAHKLQDEKAELVKRERDLADKIIAIDAPANLEKKIERMTAAVTKLGRVPFLTWPHDAQAKLVRWLFDARGSLKDRKDIRVYIRPLKTGFKWEAKGLFGDIRGAFVYGDEGGEHAAADDKWDLGAEHVLKLAEIVNEFDLEPAPQRVTDRKVRAKAAMGV